MTAKRIFFAKGEFLRLYREAPKSYFSLLSGSIGAIVVGEMFDPPSRPAKQRVYYEFVRLVNHMAESGVAEGDKREVGGGVRRRRIHVYVLSCVRVHAANVALTPARA